MMMMISTFATLEAPTAGLGKASVKLKKRFRRLAPHRRVIMLQQVMKQLRAEYDRAEREAELARLAEDAVNADQIRPSVA